MFLAQSESLTEGDIKIIEIALFFQRLSVLIQRYNEVAVLVVGIPLLTQPPEDEM